MNVITLIQGIWEKYGVLLVMIGMDALLTPISRFLLPFIKTRKNAAIFHLISGLAINYIIFQERLLIPAIFSLLSWMTFNMNCLIPIIIFAGGNTYVHIKELIEGDGKWTFSISAVMMMMVHKVMATSINIYHGRQIKAGKKPKRQWQNDFALMERPSLLEWMAYTFTLYGSNSGPTYEFKIFEFILEAGVHGKIEKTDEEKRLVKTRWIGAWFWIAMNLILLPRLQIQVYGSQFYARQNIVVRALLILPITAGLTSRYFCAWFFIESSLYELGISSSGLTTCEDISNSSLYHVLCSNTCAEWLQRWNHSAHVMFKRYLMYPLLDIGVPHIFANWSIFAASALWHGFEPVFYLVLPEMLALTRADSLITKAFPHPTTLLGKGLRHLWIIGAMFNNTSTWWYRTACAFFYVRKQQNYLWTIITFSVWIFMEIYCHFQPKMNHSINIKEGQTKGETSKEVSKKSD